MYDFSNLKDELQKVDEWLSNEFSRIHTGRATPVLLDGVVVESYGSHVPIKNIASISIEDPRTLRISPWDKNQIKDIEKAIGSSQLGLSVSVDDQGLRASFPPLTAETRENLVKVLKEKLEEARISIRLAREKTWDDVQQKAKEGTLDEDEKFRLKDELQKLIDEANKNLESLFEKKEKDLLTQ